MFCNFDILWGNKVVGTAILHTEGLYYRVECKCTLPDSDFYVVEIRMDDSCISLGTCVPIGNGFGLTKRIPVKAIRNQPFSFNIHPKNQPMENKSNEVRVGEPVPFLADLENMTLKSANSEFCDFQKRE